MMSLCLNQNAVKLAEVIMHLLGGGQCVLSQTTARSNDFAADSY